jgi:hypothetical protein
MSYGAVNAVFRARHRRMARTLLGELGWNPEALKCQLSHLEPGVFGIYNKAKHLSERRKIM